MNVTAASGMMVIKPFSTCRGIKRRTARTARLSRRQQSGEEGWKRRRIPGKHRHGSSSSSSHHSGITLSSILPGGCCCCFSSPEGPAPLLRGPGWRGGHGPGPPPPRRKRKRPRCPQEVPLPRRPTGLPGRCAATGGGERPPGTAGRPGPDSDSAGSAQCRQVSPSPAGGGGTGEKEGGSHPCPTRPYLVEVGVAEHLVAPLHGELQGPAGVPAVGCLPCLHDATRRGEARLTAVRSLRERRRSGGSSC